MRICGEIRSPYAITFSVRWLINHVGRHPFVGDAQARPTLVQCRIVAESYGIFKIAFHRQGRDIGKGIELVHGISHWLKQRRVCNQRRVGGGGPAESEGQAETDYLFYMPA